MTSEEFDLLLREARARQDVILKQKGDDYTRREPDRLSNFKRAGADFGVSPLVVWGIFFKKHLDAIQAFVKTGKAESEAIEGRFDDAINYLYLGLALVKELEDE